MNTTLPAVARSICGLRIKSQSDAVSKEDHEKRNLRNVLLAVALRCSMSLPSIGHRFRKLDCTARQGFVAYLDGKRFADNRFPFLSTESFEIWYIASSSIPKLD